MKNKKWVSQEELCDLTKIPEIQLGWKLVQYGLKNSTTGMPTEEALKRGAAQIKRRILGPNLVEWDYAISIGFIQQDPEFKVIIESLIQKGLDICSQAYSLSESGEQKAASAMESKFWESIPEWAYDEVRRHVEEIFLSLLPNLTGKLLKQAAVESMASGEILEFTPFRKEGFESLLSEIESHCSRESLITVNLGGRTGINLELRNKSGTFLYGQKPEDRDRLLETLPYGVLVLVHNLKPEGSVKEVFGYHIGTTKAGFFYKKIDRDRLKRSYELDLHGNPLPAPEDVEFL